MVRRRGHSPLPRVCISLMECDNMRACACVCAAPVFAFGLGACSVLTGAAVGAFMRPFEKHCAELVKRRELSQYLVAPTGIVNMDHLDSDEAHRWQVAAEEVRTGAFLRCSKVYEVLSQRFQAHAQSEPKRHRTPFHPPN